MCSLITTSAAWSSWPICKPLTPIHASCVCMTCFTNGCTVRKMEEPLRFQLRALWGFSGCRALGIGEVRAEGTELCSRTRVTSKDGRARPQMGGWAGSCPHQRSCGKSVRSPPGGFHVGWRCRSQAGGAAGGAGSLPEEHELSSDTDKRKAPEAQGASV